MSSTLDLNNIQGDILDGLPKKGQTFLFFRINNTRVQDFCTQLLQLIPLISTAANVQDDRARIAREKKRAAEHHTNPTILDLNGINIAFSQKGLQALSINDNIGDDVFTTGMVADAPGLGDDLTQWEEGFKQDIHGVILITGSSHPEIAKTLAKVQENFQVGKPGATIQQVVQVTGHTRPGAISGHEHFGFADGISQPLVDGFPSLPNRGQEVIAQGVVLAGREGDTVARPPWAVDGSFLAFRQLKQLVPEFDNFLEQHPLPVPSPGAPGDPTGADLLGARLVGRWKSGAPIDLAPLRDDATLGADASRNNAFRYDVQRQDRCPFAAHTRKTNPRSDLDAFGGTEIRRIIRRGIQFGPEVTAEEQASKASSKDPKLERGLLFVSYQSNLANGFQFIQKRWANNPTFPPAKQTAIPPILNPPNGAGPGFDAIIGVSQPGQVRALVGTNPSPADATQSLTLTNIWVVPRGGEYFFSPSISALNDTFAQAA